MPTLAVGTYAPFGIAGGGPRHDLHDLRLYSSLRHVADPTKGAYIATNGVATHAPPVGLTGFWCWMTHRSIAIPQGAVPEPAGVLLLNL